MYAGCTGLPPSVKPTGRSNANWNGLFCLPSSPVERLVYSGLDVYQSLFVLNVPSASGLSGQLRVRISVFRQLLCELNRA